MIKDCQSEPHNQHQNPIKGRLQDLKRMIHGIMDRVGCPPVYWLLCLLYVIGLLNILSNSKRCIPLTIVTGQITDISPYLDFHFWQEVFVVATAVKRCLRTGFSDIICRSLPAQSYLLAVYRRLCTLLMSPYTSYDSADSQDIFPIRNTHARRSLSKKILLTMERHKCIRFAHA